MDIESLNHAHLFHINKHRLAKEALNQGDIDFQSSYKTDETLQFADRKWKIIAKSANTDLYPEWSWSSLHIPIAIFILSCILAFYLRRAGLREF